MKEHNNGKADCARHDKMAAIQTSYSGAATFRRNTERASGLREIRRQPLGCALLDQPRDRVSKATQVERPICNHHRQRIGSTPPTMGRQFGPSPSLTLTLMATGPPALQSMPCTRHASGAGGSTGCSTLT